MSIYFSLSGKRRQTSGTDQLLTDVFGILRNLNRGIWLKNILNILFPGNKWLLDDLDQANFRFFNKLKMKKKSPDKGVSELEIDLMIEGRDFIIFLITGSAIKNSISLIQLASLYCWNIKKDCFFIFLSKDSNQPEIINKLKETDYAKELFSGRQDYLLLSRRVGWLNWNRLAYILSDSINLFQSTEKKFVLDIINLLHLKKLAAVRYFAYGSNLNVDQMEKRAPGHSYSYKAKAIGYEIYFPHYSSKWKGGVASLKLKPGSVVQGVVYHVSEYDLANLDHYEGVDKKMYYRDTIKVFDFSGNAHWVFTYFAVKDEEEFEPSNKYINSIVAGGLHHKLDPEYIEAIKGFAKI